MEINLSALKKFGAIALVLIALGAGAYYLFMFFSKPIAPLPDPIDTGALAARGAEVYFTLNHEEEKPVDAWLERVCEISTEAGCEITQVFMQSAVSNLLEVEKVKNECDATSYELVDSGVETDGEYEDVVFKWEIWRVSVTLSAPWAGQNAETEVYVAIDTSEGDWMLNHVLLPDEAKKYSEEGVKEIVE